MQAEHVEPPPEFQHDSGQPHLDLHHVRKTLRVVEEALGQNDLTPLFEQCLGRSPQDASP
jgi:hypothetical protein